MKFYELLRSVTYFDMVRKEQQYVRDKRMRKQYLRYLEFYKFSGSEFFDDCTNKFGLIKDFGAQFETQFVHA